MVLGDLISAAGGGGGWNVQNWEWQYGKNLANFDIKFPDCGIRTLQMLTDNK